MTSNCLDLKVLVLLAIMLAVSCAKPRSGTDARPAVQPFDVTSSLGVEMVVLPGGEFLMGSSVGRPEESPQHRVRVTPFAIDRYEVSQKQFADLELPDPSQFKSEDRPVEQIRWVSAAEYCNERSRAEGLQPCYDEATFACDFDASGYRLPTEAEWEYAARAGSETVDVAARSPQRLKSYACYAGNSKQKTDPVGTKRPNEWGLHDMLGNVAEWCHDMYGPEYYAHSTMDDPRGPSEGDKRVMRGGSWKSSADACRIAAREGRVAGFTDACFTGNTLGFRCVRRVTPDEQQRLHQQSSGTE